MLTKRQSCADFLYEIMVISKKWFTEDDLRKELTRMAGSRFLKKDSLIDDILETAKSPLNGYLNITERMGKTYYSIGVKTDEYEI